MLKYLRVLFVLSSLTLCCQALADSEIRYTIEELKSLSEQGLNRELLDHLLDVSPSKRGRDWYDLATSATSGVISANRELGLHADNLQVANRVVEVMPFLLTQSDIMMPLVESVLLSQPDCLSGYSTECLSLLIPLLSKQAKGPQIAAELMQRTASLEGLKPLQFIYLYEIAARSQNGSVCQDDRLQQAVAEAAGKTVSSQTDLALIVVTKHCSAFKFVAVENEIKSSQLAANRFCPAMLKNRQLGKTTEMACRQ